MKRWIVNPKMRTVRECKPTGPWDDRPCADEFLYDAPTYADAMAAGRRRRLAEEALEGAVDKPLYVVVGDRIEPRASGSEARYILAELFTELSVAGYDVWREGTGLVVLGRLP